MAKPSARTQLFAVLPRDAHRLDVHTMVADLPESSQELLRAYLIERLPGSPEVCTALFHVAREKRENLRVKELIETVEACVHAGSAINAAIDAARRDAARPAPTAVYDVACGHGLGAVLLAYRFAKLKVVAVDTFRRPCFDAFVAAFVEHCTPAAHEAVVLENLEFVEGRADTLQMERHAFILCVHGCNELSPFAFERAMACRGGCAVMPCCIRGDRLRTSSAAKRWAVDDETRYALHVGWLAGKYAAAAVAPIPPEITNKNLVLLGEYYTPS